MLKDTSKSSGENVRHPGEALKEKLKEEKMSQRQLALRTGVTEPFISRIISGQKGMSVSFAKKLEYVLNIDSSYWINLQGAYEDKLAAKKELNEVSLEEFGILVELGDILEYLREMRLLRHEIQGARLVLWLRKFLNISNLLRIPEVLEEGGYDLSSQEEAAPYMLFAWLKICQLIMSNQKKLSKVNTSCLEGKIGALREVLLAKASEIQSILAEHLAECGINFLIVPYFDGVPVQALIERNKGGSLSLLLPNRPGEPEAFWLSFFRQVNHILKGFPGKRYLDYLEQGGAASDEASKFAQDVLLKPEAYESFLKKNDFSEESIKVFSEEMKIPSYILWSRLKKQNKIS